MRGLFRETPQPLAWTSARLRCESMAQQLYHSPAAKWFFEKCERASGLGPTPNGRFGKRRDENDWKAASLGDQAILKIKAAHAGHLHVGDQAGAVVNPWRAQEIVSRIRTRRRRSQATSQDSPSRRVLTRRRRQSKRSEPSTRGLYPFCAKAGKERPAQSQHPPHAPSS